MRKVIAVIIAALTIAMVAGALWSWQQASAFTSLWEQPKQGVLAMRLLAAGLVLTSQSLLLSLVTASLFGAGRAERITSWCAGALGMMAIATAIALGVAGR